MFTNIKGERFIVPGFQKVDINTTLNDIQWVRPKVKVTRSKTIEKISKSSSSDAVYTTKHYPDSGPCVNAIPSGLKIILDLGLPYLFKFVNFQSAITFISYLHRKYTNAFWLLQAFYRLFLIIFTLDFILLRVDLVLLF